ncbi:MAG: glycosyltransferase family 2 protein [Candidatus Omnitrophica bacterium]|nr:glycosyltransferase family 2 protein [Candidatus Omnitrophota bacterium]
MTKRGTISAVIITFNEELNIRRCLESIKWVDEIVVVDGGSQDKTVEIAKGYGAKVITHKFEGDFGLERNIGNENATSDWILALDADEEIPEATRKAIEEILKDNPKVSAYNVLRNQYFLGFFLRYGGRQHRIVNFYKRGKAHFEGKVHHLVRVDGVVRDADFAINHYPFNSISQFIQKHDRYTTYEADEMFEKFGSGKLAEVRYNLTWKPAKIFFKTYIKKKGYKDGVHGLIFCILFSWSYFIRWAKYWEKSRYQS